MFKLLDWIIQNWKSVMLIISVMMLLVFVVPLTRLIRGAKEGAKEVLTPLGFLVFLILLVFAIWLIYFFKGTFTNV